MGTLAAGAAAGAVVLRCGGCRLPDRIFHVANEGILEVRGATLVDQLLRRIAREDLSAMHERDAIAAHPFVHEMRGHEDRHALLAREIAQQLPEAVARDRIDAGGGLIEDQQLRPVEHRDCEREPLAQAHRQ